MAQDSGTGLISSICAATDDQPLVDDVIDRDLRSTFSKKGLHFLHLNVRSLLLKIEEIRELVKHLKVGVICFTESWLDDTVSDEEIAINNYNIVRKDRSRKGGGVCVYVHFNVAFNIREDLASDLEIVSMDICLPKNKTHFIWRLL